MSKKSNKTLFRIWLIGLVMALVGAGIALIGAATATAIGAGMIILGMVLCGIAWFLWYWKIV